MHENGSFLTILKQSQDEKENVLLQQKRGGVSDMTHYFYLREQNPQFYEDQDRIERRHSHAAFLQSFLLRNYGNMFSIGSAFLDSVNFILSIVYKIFLSKTTY